MQCRKSKNRLRPQFPCFCSWCFQGAASRDTSALSPLPGLGLSFLSTVGEADAPGYLLPPLSRLEDSLPPSVPSCLGGGVDSNCHAVVQPHYECCRRKLRSAWLCPASYDG